MLPSDLLPIPTQPWDERPASLPLDEEECRTALWLNRGNVSQAAALLKVTSQRLRNYVNAKPRLLAEQKEARERLLDRAEEVVYEALFDPADATRRDGMTKFLLNSAIAKYRQLGSGAGPQMNIKNVGPIQITWGEPPPDKDAESTSPIIEGEVVGE